MKIAVIGGGGVRSVFLAKSIAARAEELKINELVFMDNDEKKLRIYGTMAKKTSNLICPSLDFKTTTNAVEAVENADYVITTIRVGGDDMRVKDERAALNMGVLGQETTGAAGLSFAMRSISALADYCELIKKHAKKAARYSISQTLRALYLRLCVIWGMILHTVYATHPAECSEALKSFTAQKKARQRAKYTDLIIFHISLRLKLTEKK